MDRGTRLSLLRGSSVLFVTLRPHRHLLTTGRGCTANRCVHFFMADLSAQKATIQTPASYLCLSISINMMFKLKGSNGKTSKLQIPQLMRTPRPRPSSGPRGRRRPEGRGPRAQSLHITHFLPGLRADSARAPPWTQLPHQHSRD